MLYYTIPYRPIGVFNNCLVCSSANCGLNTVNQCLLPADDTHEHRPEAIVGAEVDNRVDERMRVVEHVRPHDQVDRCVADFVGEHQRDDPDRKPADEEHERDQGARECHAKGAFLAPGGLHLLHCRRDSGAATGRSRSDAGVVLSVDDDGDDGAVGGD